MAVSPSPADSGARRNAADKVDAVREPNAAELRLFMITVRPRHAQKTIGSTLQPRVACLPADAGVESPARMRNRS